MKKIKGYEGLYFADKGGKIWVNGSSGRWKEGRFLKPWLIGHGYEMVMLYKEGTPRKFLVHRLIAISFITNHKNLPEVNHKNHNIRDNRPENLEWCTSKQNKAHAWENGLYTHKGENHYLAKLTKNNVKKIFEMKKQGNLSQAKIAKIFGVSPMAISLLLNRKTWKNTRHIYI